MASNTYVQHYSDGSQKLVRRLTKQGRKAKTVDFVKVKVEIMTLPVTKDHAEAEARKYGMSLSAYGDLALSLFDLSKFSS